MKKGLYEKIIDKATSDELSKLAISSRTEKLDAADSHSVLAQHLSDIIASTLHRLPSDNRLGHQRNLINKIISVLSEADDSLEDQATLPETLERLLEVSDQNNALIRPDTPASESSLLTGTRIDPSLLSQLKQEIASADRIYILCSFIKWSGIALLRDALEDFTSRDGTRLRVITTSYMGATDLAAVKTLAKLPNTEVRVSYDTHRTRLHAKAYLFERDTGFSTAYIGSANLSRPALTEGLEWTVKATQYADKPIWEKVLATFDTYWQDPEFEKFNENSLRKALQKENTKNSPNNHLALFNLNPYQFQQEVLDSLENDRKLRTAPHRQLVVAATGTGKTMIAAFDYRNQIKRNNGKAPSLLFIAHRKEILEQAISTFRAVLKDQNFGDLLDGTNTPDQDHHLFATVQTIRKRELTKTWSASKFDYVLIDETHRSSASSYQGVVSDLKPKILLGLTATPERADGNDITTIFDDRIVCEIRLPDAINRRLVAPFHYYGVSDIDEIDYSKLTWERGGFRTSELDNLVTGNDMRAQNIVDQCRRRIPNLNNTRGIGFCVSIAHANFMASFFNKSGIPSLSLTSESTKEERKSARKNLKERNINFIFSVDLFNEGIDIPEIDTVLFLRPTESLTIFLQQLGRGLRLSDEKDYLTVLDFIGNMHKNFRFENRLRALSSNPSSDINEEINHEFPHLPAGCAIQLERIAKQRILQNIKDASLDRAPQLIRSISDFSSSSGRDVKLSDFLNHFKIMPENIYRIDTWDSLCIRSGIINASPEPDNRLLQTWLRRICHANDIPRLNRWKQWLNDGKGNDPLVHAFLNPLITNRTQSNCVKSAWELINNNPRILSEAKQLIDWLLQHPSTLASPPMTETLPLTPHASYTRDEILILTGEWNWEKQPPFREGVRHVPKQKIDLFLATIQKSEKHYSPSTLYADYAISNTLFHWQSQSTTSDKSKTGNRYINHKSLGYTPLLFVREQAKVKNYAQPYHFLGPVSYQYHEGSRPMSITWKLDIPMPARHLRAFKTLSIAG
ncbi:DEAD/DEAH box helicase [Alcanivorax sp.]|uniref:DEAD/DEAH box helicase n=1 Tax=Alcanivorax sp. TaxID=1872427 RepID=UPI0025BA8A99|nr:DEAD/DEAH box helicase [Alcanivorax sp.]